MRIRATILAVSLFTAFINGCGGGADTAALESTSLPDVAAAQLQGLQNMAAGFQIVNANGIVQVDENYVNLGLVAKGTITIPAGGIGGMAAPAQISFTGASPILCIRPVSTYAFIRSVTKLGNTFSYTVNGGYSGAGNTSPTAETFNWYIFDRMSQIAVTNYGIQIYNASGELTFNSSSNPMRIAGVGQTPNAALSTAPATVSAAQAGIYAACISNGRLFSQVVSTQPPISMIIREGIKVNSTGGTTAGVADLTIGTLSSLVSNTGGQILLVDVSGL